MYVTDFVLSLSPLPQVFTGFVLSLSPLPQVFVVMYVTDFVLSLSPLPQVFVVMQQILPTIQELVTKWKTEPNIVEVSQSLMF